MRAIAACLRRCKTLGIVPTKSILLVSVERQRAVLHRSSLHPAQPARFPGAEGERRPAGGRIARPGTRRPAPIAVRCRLGERQAEGALRAERYHPVCIYRVSTSRFGIGQTEGSNCTPLGLHRVVEKIGGGWPVGTVFKNRKAAGFSWKGLPDAKITTRILWLEGLEPGFNRGGDVDSYARYIYIHGTADQTTLGRPASCGCIHLAAKDLIPLFDKLMCGTLVWITI